MKLVQLREKPSLIVNLDRVQYVSRLGNGNLIVVFGDDDNYVEFHRGAVADFAWKKIMSQSVQ